MLQQPSICSCGHAGRSLLRWWATSINRHTVAPHSHAVALTAASCQRSPYSSARQLVKRTSRLTSRSARPSRLALTQQPQQPADVSVVTPQSLEEADRKESEEEKVAGSSIVAIHRQLKGLNAIAYSVQADIAAHNSALQQHSESATAAPEAIKRIKHRAATLRTSYDALLQSVALSHKQLTSTRQPDRPQSRVSAQLAALERVWVDMCKYSQPTTEAFTSVIVAYGKEGRRRRIRDLVERWLEDRDTFMQQLGARSGKEDSWRQSDTPAAVDEESADVREAKERKRLAALKARRARETAMGLPTDLSLYPAVKMDTYSFNASLSSYLSSLPLHQLTSQSKELSFPLSLLPLFKADTYTITALMRAHGQMGETGQVVRLFEEYKRMRREVRLARGGARELQAVRQKNKKDLQYIYATLIHSLALAKDVSAAETMWDEIKAKVSGGQLEINRTLYHSMLSVYATVNQQEKLRSISVEMSRAGLSMDEHSVCTVINRLCSNGHVADAIMLHTRIPHGSMGPAKQHRMTYTCLLKQLVQQPDVPLLTIAEVYRQGVESGLLWTAPCSVRTSGMAAEALASTWVADLRLVGAPLEMIPVALHFHLSEMLGAYMASVRRGRKMVPRQLLILLRRQDEQPRDRSQQEEEADVSDMQGAGDVSAGHRSGHRMSVGALDRDERENEEDEEREGMEGQHDDDADDAVPATSLRARSSTSSVLIDPFATEEEQGQLSQLDAWKVKGTFVQRYVQHLLQQEWPSLVTLASHSNTNQSADVDSIDPSTPALESASPVPVSAPQLRISRNQLSFWLAWHAHVAAGDDAELFPPPRMHGQSSKFVSTMAQRIRQQQQRLEVHQQQWERTKRGQPVPAAAASSGMNSLIEGLAEYRKRAREELMVKARIFNTKRLPAALNERRVGSRSRLSTAGERRQESQPQEKMKVESTGSAARSLNRPDKRSTMQGRSAASDYLSAAVGQRRAAGERLAQQRRREVEADDKGKIEAERGSADSAERVNRRSSARLRPVASEILSSETLSSLLDIDKGLSPATKQAVQAMHQQQEQSRAQRQAVRASE